MEISVAWNVALTKRYAIERVSRTTSSTCPGTKTSMSDYVL